MTGFTIEVDDSRVRAWFGKMPASIQQRVETAVYLLAEKLKSHVINDKLLGQVLNRVSGRLGQSIQQRVETSDKGATGIVYSAGDVPYARIHEYGGQTAAHVIEARGNGTLAFLWHGNQAFFKKVNHPGSKIPERSYMRSSLADMKEEIIERLRAATVEGAQQ